MPRCIATSDKELARPGEPIWLSHRSKPNLAHTVFEAPRQKNNTPALTRYPHSAMCNGARRQNQAGPKLPYDTDSDKTNYIQLDMQRILYQYHASTRKKLSEV